MAAVIPMVLHRVVPEDTSDDVERWWRGWQDMHPTWVAHTWRDPLDPAAYPLSGHVFDRCTSGAQLAGLVRLEALFWMGGVYLDSDVEPLGYLDPLRSVGPAWACSEDGTHLTDAVLGAEVGSEAILAALVRAVKMLGDDPVPNAQSTGPLNLEAAWHGRDDVTILARRLFYPYGPTELGRAGENFAQTSPDSIGVHHWRFSWAGT